MGIEQRFDIPFVAALALREKAIQQNYRPIIAVHKWFARRPGTLFRALMLSEFVDKKLSQSYFLSHQLDGKRVADPFMGGRTPSWAGHTAHRGEPPRCRHTAHRGEPPRC